MSVINVKNLRYSYGTGALRREALKGVDLEIKKGEIVILTGPSGSGKTTLLTIVGGLRNAFDGSVEVLGKQMIGANENTRVTLRKHIGFIFQQHNLLKSLTALQNVCMALELRDGFNEQNRQRTATEILESVGLSDFLHKKPDELSGGQKQRISVARSLVAKPDIILADEPTASLDKQNGQEIVHILKQLAREQGTTILLVTHDYRILDVADRSLILEDGEITKTPP